MKFARSWFRKLKNFFSRYYSVIFFVLLSIILYLFSNRIDQKEILSILKETGALGPLLFILLNLFTYIIAPLSNSPLMFAAFSVFEREIIWYIAIAMIISYFSNFWIARTWGRPIVAKLIGKHHMEKVDSLAKDKNMRTFFFFLRVFQGGAQDFISFAAGFSNLKFITYFLTSVLATIPQTTIWYILAYNTPDPISFILLAQAIGLVMPAIFLIILFFARKRIFNPRLIFKLPEVQS